MRVVTEHPGELLRDVRATVPAQCGAGGVVGRGRIERHHWTPTAGGEGVLIFTRYRPQAPTNRRVWATAQLGGRWTAHPQPSAHGSAIGRQQERSSKQMVSSGTETSKERVTGTDSRRDAGGGPPCEWVTYSSGSVLTRGRPPGSGLCPRRRERAVPGFAGIAGCSRTL